MSVAAPARAAWAALGQAMESPLTPEEITRLRGLGDALDLDEVEQVYLPLIANQIPAYVPKIAFETIRDGNYEIYVDIATPPRWDGDRVTMIDLDLDVDTLLQDSGDLAGDHRLEQEAPGEVRDHEDRQQDPQGQQDPLLAHLSAVLAG